MSCWCGMKFITLLTIATVTETSTTHAALGYFCFSDCFSCAFIQSCTIPVLQAELDVLVDLP